MGYQQRREEIIVIVQLKNTTHSSFLLCAFFQMFPMAPPITKNGFLIFLGLLFRFILRRSSCTSSS